MQASHEFKSYLENYQISASLFNIGNDYLIVITGGDHPHIGSITTKAAGQDLQTKRFPSHDGRFHQDYLLAEPLVKGIASLISGNITVLAGVHVDGITQKQILASQDMITDITQQIKIWLQHHSYQVTPPKYYRNGEKPK